MIFLFKMQFNDFLLTIVPLSGGPFSCKMVNICKIPDLKPIGQFKFTQFPVPANAITFTAVAQKKLQRFTEIKNLETTVLKVNQRESAGDLSRYSFHMADAGTDAMEREKAFLLASAEGRILMEINEALRRLYRGEFGSCEICGLPIGRARLEAMLHTRLCLSCKEKEERASRGAP